MAYHEAFWAVVGAASPVIALASIVSVSDMMNHAFEWSRYRRDRPRRAVRELTERSALGMLTKFSIITQATNLVLQALALLFALTKPRSCGQHDPTVDCYRRRSSRTYQAGDRRCCHVSSQDHSETNPRSDGRVTLVGAANPSMRTRCQGGIDAHGNSRG